jgi:hypothetical protein
MMPTTCRWRSAAAAGVSDDGDGGAAADWAGRRVTTGRPLLRQRPSPQYDIDYANRGAGSDDATLADGRRKKIRRMGNKHSFFRQVFFDRYST